MKNIFIQDRGFTSLEGLNKHWVSKYAPEGIENVFCSGNELTSLKGLPEGVKYVDCSDNKLTSLEGLPASVERVVCGKNPYLTSLEGLPEKTKISCDVYTPIYTQVLLQGRYAGSGTGLTKIIKYIQ